MSSDEKKMLHFEGTFRGLYRIGKSLTNLGIYDFRRMEWEFMDIRITRELGARDIEAEKVLDFQHLPILFSNTRTGLFRSPSAELIVQDERFGKYAPDLHEVILTGHTGARQDPHSPIRFTGNTMVSYDIRECSGTIRFSVPNPAPPKPLPEPETEIRESQQVTIPPTQTGPTVLIAGNGDIKPQGDTGVGTARRRPWTLPDPMSGEVRPAGVRKSWQQRLGGCMSTLIGLGVAAVLLTNFPMLGIVALALLASYLMRGTSTGPTPRTSMWTVVLLLTAIWLLYQVYGVNTFLFNGLLFLTLMYLFTRGSRSGFWRTVVGLLMLLAILAVGSTLFSDWQKLIPELQDDDRSSVRITDIDPLPDPKGPDSLYRHTAEWNDFDDRNYSGDYYTTYRQVLQSGNFHHALAEMETPEDEDRYWRSIYQLLSRNDTRKLDSLVDFFRTRADSLGLQPAGQAEMVVTFIQQIPYYLVHDGTCEQALSGDNEFMVDYHRQGRPCVPEAVAGIQSPYEFIHDLKGDCDTRTVLAWTLLSALNIPSSVWISQTYGHSVLGVGLPAGGGNYKTVNGVRHFAVELTAEGYRLGMISPDQTDMDNWKVIVFKNF